MASFTKNERIDPYNNCRFLVFFNGKTEPVAGISKVSPLKRSTEIISHREGGDLTTPRHSPGASKFEAITLERGVTFDREFEEWANLIYSTKGDGLVSLKNYKRDLLISLNNLQGVPVRSYKVFRCWVSEYTAMAELDANANAITMESIIIQNEGWERDPDVKEKPEL